MALKKKFLGELLIEAGAITKEQRDKALKEQKRLGKRLGEVLVAMGILTEDGIVQALSRQLHVPFMELKSARIDSALIDMVPEALARKHRVLPVEIKDGRLVLAMADPLDIFAADEIKRLAKMPVDTAVATESEILKTLDKYYKGEMQEAFRAVEAGYYAEEERAAPLAEAAAEDTPVVRLVNTTISQAVKDRASDIHIEPHADVLRVRFRIDGMLHEVMTPPKHLHAGVISRVKILSGMDIAEKRVPQDGRFPINIEGRQFDVRSSTLPTLYGEKVVMRLLEKTSGLPSLSELGLEDEMLRQYHGIISEPYGFILATGPTGCGKTTTMYSSLNNISTLEKNIITVEDPIEYNLKGINQVQVNPKAGLTFASGLRSILRQDPDIIMIGEIRDLETAAIATHAALTGHLVLSTLHTNESIGAIARLMDMGVEPFLITSSLMGVLGQRLIRKICPHCRESYAAEPEMLKELGIAAGAVLYRGGGCEECRNTGYLGREGLFELLLISEGVKRLIVEKATASNIKEEAIREGFKTLRQEGIRKALNGVTALEEVMRVTPHMRHGR
ncbi:MAG: ATPase, T2SS/T4P/T4SS family [Thermodesulfovibrionales bacterium]|nr:ATPase, T2SS/T4P/T4SS family [Thermodesulfovibrionales bacterium]